MSRIRFSLAGLLAFTLFAGFMSAALHYATDFWTSAAVSLSGLLLLLGVLAAVLRPAARPFWIGFIVFGWAYFYASVGPGSATLLSRLLTTPLLAHAESLVKSPAAAAQDEIVWNIDMIVQRKLWTYQRQSLYPVPPPENFLAIGHAALAVVIGLLGGVAGCLIRGRAGRPDSTAPGASV